MASIAADVERVSQHPTFGLRREQLANGVTLLVQRRGVAPAAALVTHVRAGFLDEPDELVGISHVLEHMLFKGTPSLAPGELAQRTQALGGTLNAYTSYDRTVYYASGPARHADALIALQADQVRHPLLDADELRRELGVIIQEARRKLDSPGAVAGETLHELLYAQHRIRRWRIGTDVALEGFTRADVAGYYGSRYLPSRVIVALVADLDEDAALDMLRAHWGDWTGPDAIIPSGPDESTPPVVGARRMRGDVALTDLVLGWRAPGVLDPSIPALDVAAAILGRGRGSRFFLGLRQPGLVNGIGVSAYGVVDTGVFAIGAELDAVNLQRTLPVIGATLRDLREHNAGDAEFDRARTLLRASMARRLERYESRAIALADAEAAGDVTRLDRDETDVMAVTTASVRDVVNQWLSPEGVAGVAYLPSSSDERFDAELLAESMRGHSGSVTAVAPAEALGPVARRSANVGGGSWSRTGPPAVYHLAEGSFDILASRFGETGQVSMSVYRARTDVEDAATAGLGVLTMRALMRGTRYRDATGLALAAESMGGSIAPTISVDLMGLGITVLTEHLGEAAALLAEVLYQPRLDADAIATECALLLDDARAVADDMMRFPLQLALGVAFGNSGYGSPSLGTDRSIVTFDDAAVRASHARMLRGGRTTIIAVGDAEPERLAELAAEVFAWDNVAVDGVARLSPSIESIHPGTRVEHRDRKQAALAMLFPGPARNDPARFAAEVWSSVAAGLGGRMFESLRSARSLAYTVIANSWQRRRAGGLLTYIAMDPARLDEARAAMLEELATFRREPPSDVEVSRAVAMLAGQVEVSRQTAGGFAGEIADAWLLGSGLDELEHPAAPYRLVTRDAVHAVTAAALDPAARAEGVVTPPPE